MGFLESRSRMFLVPASLLIASQVVLPQVHSQAIADGSRNEAAIAPTLEEGIVYSTFRPPNLDIYLFDEPGRPPTRLTDHPALDYNATFSPDGKWIVFSTTRAGSWKLWIERSDGSEGRFLEPSRLGIPDTSMHARFSPDGEWVLFTSNRGGFNDEWPLTPAPQPYGDLWAVPFAGGAAVRLIHNKWEDGPSDWGPIHLPGR